MKMPYALACAVAVSTAGFAAVAADDLNGGPWVGDGQPERNGADWYDEVPAPEFRAAFTLPDGTREAKVHFACAGFGWFSFDGEAMMRTDGLDTLWTPYDKTVYSKAFTVKAGHQGLEVSTAGSSFRFRSTPSSMAVTEAWSWRMALS